MLNIWGIEKNTENPSTSRTVSHPFTPMHTVTMFCSSSATTMDSFTFNTLNNWWGGRIFLAELLASNRESYQNLFTCICPVLYQTLVWSLQAAFFHIPQTRPGWLSSFMLVWQLTENILFFLTTLQISFKWTHRHS